MAKQKSMGLVRALYVNHPRVMRIGLPIALGCVVIALLWRSWSLAGSGGQVEFLAGVLVFSVIIGVTHFEDRYDLADSSALAKLLDQLAEFPELRARFMDELPEGDVIRNIDCTYLDHLCVVQQRANSDAAELYKRREIEAEINALMHADSDAAELLRRQKIEAKIDFLAGRSSKDTAK